VLEQGARDVLIEAGGGERMQREGMIHEGIYLRSEGETHRIPVTD
jgi:p-hydroxybenzoate 3-monooxygenase